MNDTPDLRRALGEPDEQFHQATLRALHKIQAGGRKRREFSKKAVLAAALAVVLVLGGAFAAVRSSAILANLFGERTPSQAAEDAVRAGVAHTAEDGFSLSLDEYIYDGMAYDLRFSASSARDEAVYVLFDVQMDYVWNEDAQAVGGAYGGYSSGNIGDLDLAMLGGECEGVSMPKTQTAFFGSLFSTPLAEETIPVKITARFYTTDLTPKSTGTEVWHPDDSEKALIESMITNNQIAVTSEGVATIVYMPAFLEEEEKLFAQATEDTFDAARLRALEECGLLKFEKELTIETELVRGDTEILGYVTAGTQLQFENLTMTVRELRFGLAHTTIRYDLYFADASHLGEADESFKNVLFALADGDGNFLGYMSVSADREIYEDGTAVVHVTGELPGQEKAPDQVMFVHIPEAESIKLGVTEAEMAELIRESSDSTCVDVNVIRH